MEIFLLDVDIKLVRDDSTRVWCVAVQLHQNSLQQMQDMYERRQAALEHHRQEYERTHPHHSQQQHQRRPIYQTDYSRQLRVDDSDDVGEDEID